MAVLWEEVLGIEGLGVEDNFFELGGDSTAAARLMPRLNRAFGLEAPLRTLFQNPTIARLVATLREDPARREKMTAAVRDLVSKSSAELVLPVPPSAGLLTHP
jgi:acyl carrier protein